jgi:hypothetical protein
MNIPTSFEKWPAAGAGRETIERVAGRFERENDPGTTLDAKSALQGEQQKLSVGVGSNLLRTGRDRFELFPTRFSGEIFLRNGLNLELFSEPDSI